MKIVLGLGAALAGALLAACSSGSSGTASSTPSASPSASPAAASPTGAGPRGARGPAASGIIAQVSPGSIEVQSQQAGQVTVTYTAKTAFSETAATTRAAVTAGSCVVATAPTGTTASARSFAATAVIVSRSTNGQCRQAVFGPRGAGGTGSPRAFPSGGPTRQRPSGFPSGFPAGRAFGFAANGKVTAVSGSTITVSGTDPRTRSAVTYTLTLTGTTKYSQTVQTTAKALAVGKCASANGTTNDTGAVAATSIRITPPVNGSCELGFGGRRPTTGTSGG